MTIKSACWHPDKGHRRTGCHKFFCLLRKALVLKIASQLSFRKTRFDLAWILVGSVKKWSFTKLVFLSCICLPLSSAWIFHVRLEREREREKPNCLMTNFIPNPSQQLLFFFPIMLWIEGAHFHFVFDNDYLLISAVGLSYFYKKHGCMLSCMTVWMEFELWGRNGAQGLLCKGRCSPFNVTFDMCALMRRECFWVVFTSCMPWRVSFISCSAGDNFCFSEEMSCLKVLCFWSFKWRFTEGFSDTSSLLHCHQENFACFTLKVEKCFVVNEALMMEISQ